MSRPWKQKFADAFRGLREGVRGNSSLAVHFLAALATVSLAAALKMGPVEWCILLLCITGVGTAEVFNSALEALARAVTKETDPHIRDALDIAAGAVLAAGIGSVVVGLVLFGHRVGQLLSWW
jgi:diacylglycerol kinase